MKSGITDESGGKTFLKPTAWRAARDLKVNAIIRFADRHVRERALAMMMNEHAGASLLAIHCSSRATSPLHSTH
jgi:hypothetical protein